MDGIYRRIECEELRERVTTAEAAVEMIESGMSISFSSNLLPICDHLEKRVQENPNLKIQLLSGVAILEADRRFGTTGTITRRIGQQTLLRKSINAKRVKYLDTPLGSFYQSIRRGDHGSLDLAIVEAIKITREGNLIPSYRLADMANFVSAAKEVIVQLNTSCPLGLEGMHDVYLPSNPPRKDLIRICKVDDRIGSHYIPIRPEKIRCIVPFDASEAYERDTTIDEASSRISEKLISFLIEEVSGGRLPPSLLPIEMGLGKVSTAILRQLGRSDFEDMEFYSAILDDCILDLIEKGKVRAATGSGLVLSPEGERRLFDNLDLFKRHVVLRPVEITDSPEVISRLGIIALNSAIEVDIYGHVNSSHTMQGDVVSGIGGAGDFAQNAYLSIILLPSIVKNGDISCIVPMVPHVDIPEHGVHVVITEQGIADLRGLSPEERARIVIDQCANPAYRSLLQEYFEKSQELGGGHEPHYLEESFSFHQRFLKTGSMKKS